MQGQAEQGHLAARHRLHVRLLFGGKRPRRVQQRAQGGCRRRPAGLRAIPAGSPPLLWLPPVEVLRGHKAWLNVVAVIVAATLHGAHDQAERGEGRGVHNLPGRGCMTQRWAGWCGVVWWWMAGGPLPAWVKEHATYKGV